MIGVAQWCKKAVETDDLTQIIVNHHVPISGRCFVKFKIDPLSIYGIWMDFC